MEKLICASCGKEYLPQQREWKCSCGGFFDLHFTFSLDREKIKSRGCTMWRYREALPVTDTGNIVSFGEGFTPLLEIGINSSEILVKQEQLFPSGSYKDRGASLLVSKMKELGIRRVVEDSSGNAGAAVAAYCAKAGIDCDIYVPADTSRGKLAQIQMYGASLVKTPGSREATAKAVLLSAERIYYASHSWNPYFFQGTKTFAYEVSEQLGWRSPDTVILPAGNGTLLLGAYIGFTELKNAGIISTMPKLIGVQAENCAPLYAAFSQGKLTPVKIISEKTIAEGIAIAEPLRGAQMLEAVRKSGGEFIAVDEKEIKDSFTMMASQGYFIEPTSAAVVAGVRKYLDAKGKKDSEIIVTAFTGHGLKAVEKIISWL
ncbi:MAG: threonine synthase [Spirochaetia bacterium]|jgi:threonine synthase|nr:threonine synthase [Spirochaetia bacterium]